MVVSSNSPFLYEKSASRFLRLAIIQSAVMTFITIFRNNIISWWFRSG